MSILPCMVVEKSLTKYFIPQSMEGKKIGQIKGRIRGEGWSSTCTPNMSILACMVVEKSLTKNFHQKGDGRKD